MFFHPNHSVELRLEYDTLNIELNVNNRSLAIKDRTQIQLFKMAAHNETGKIGEIHAQHWALENGYQIRALNWRHGHLEIDMIATKDNRLHFFEIKTRRSKVFGFPETLVGKQKMRHFTSAGAAYLRKNPQFKWVRYNILSITIDEAERPDFFLIEDVY